MVKLDLRKNFKDLYNPSPKNVSLIEVPALNFIMIDGAIEPGSTPGNSPAFQEAVQAMYGISYTLKFMSKLDKINPIDYPVMPLEGLWWISGGEFDIRKPGNWLWTVMIMQPDHITRDMFDEGLDKLKKKNTGPVLEKIRLESLQEGLCVQIMHEGPYATEPATIDNLREYIAANGLRDLVGGGGKHHEIYLGDPRKADPTKLKTVLRHPVERKKS